MLAARLARVCGPGGRAGGPPAPVPPDVVSRDGSGTTIRAVRLTAPLRVDGQLDEAVYTDVHPMSDFIQIEPQAGAPATEKTEVWVFFDDDNVYVSARCWESQPERMVVNEMRRDSADIAAERRTSRSSFDTFYDRRNGVAVRWSTRSAAAPTARSTNERQYNGDWNPVWDVEGRAVRGRLDGRSRRSRSSRCATGPGARRSGASTRAAINRWKNEIVVPRRRCRRALGTARHLRSRRCAATLVGLEAPPGSKNLEIKPYVDRRA